MRISTTTTFYVRGKDTNDLNTYKEVLTYLKDAGFDAFDLALMQPGAAWQCLWKPETALENAAKLRAMADEIGIACNQTHAPFATSFVEEDRTKAVFEEVVRAIKVSSIMGANVVVVHPNQHLEYRAHREELKEINYRFYMSLLPYAKDCGVKIGVENMWQYDPNGKDNRVIVESTCGSMEEYVEYMDMLPREYFVACLDIGHVPLGHDTLGRVIRGLGHDRLKALHVHDNDFVSDLHALPFLGKIRFKEVTDALRDIRYDGDFTFESIRFEGSMPDELRPAAAKFEYAVGKYLVDIIER